MLAWHFLHKGGLLRDGHSPPPDGEWLEYDGPIMPCKSGLHASEHPFDALTYAPGAILCRVELEGELQSHGEPTDKWVGRRRKIVWRHDATPLLREFARWCASQVLHLWYAPQVVKDYLATGDKSLRDAAWAAARDAASAAAMDAASAAAWAAARAAAWDAQRAKFAAMCEELDQRLKAAQQEGE